MDYWISRTRGKDGRKTTLIMATSVFALLTLPNTSKGLTALQPTVVDAVNIVGSASPRRKVARLATDSDSASASRSRSATIHKPGASIRIRILDSDGVC
jgi:hypothetical protein